VAGADGQLVAWLDSLANQATNSRAGATNKVKTGGTWVELVKVKKWYYVRLMRWVPGKGKEYVSHIGTLEAVKKAGGIYAAEAERLERKRFGRIEATPGTHAGARERISD
jgi:hypothetical protein